MLTALHGFERVLSALRSLGPPATIEDDDRALDRGLGAVGCAVAVHVTDDAAANRP